MHDQELLDKCKTSRFTSLGGSQEVKGKAYYPDYLIVQLSKEEAWRVATELLNSLRLGGVLPLCLLGELKECDEEE